MGRFDLLMGIQAIIARRGNIHFRFSYKMNLVKWQVTSDKRRVYRAEEAGISDKATDIALLYHLRAYLTFEDRSSCQNHLFIRTEDTVCSIVNNKQTNKQQQQQQIILSTCPRIYWWFVTNPEKLFSKSVTTPTGTLNARISHNFKVSSPKVNNKTQQQKARAAVSIT